MKFDEDKQEKKDLFVLKIFFYFWVIIIILLYFFPYGRSTGPSMLPTAENRSYEIYFNHYYDLFEPYYGDIISFKIKEEENELVKRIVGLPGDIIEIRDYKLYLNNIKIKTKKINKKSFSILGKQVSLTIYKEKINPKINYNILKNDNNTNCVNSKLENLKVSVPKDHFFVLGDNRFCSHDSRNFGSIKKTDINKKLLFFYKPKSYQSFDWD